MYDYDPKCDACLKGKMHSQIEHKAHIKAWPYMHKLDMQKFGSVGKGTRLREEIERADREIDRIREQFGRAQKSYEQWKIERAKVCKDDDNSTPLRLVKNYDQHQE